MTGDAGMSRTEAATLRELRGAVAKATAQLDEDSPWAGTLAVLGEELGEGQPFIFKVALAPSSRAMASTAESRMEGR